MIDKILMQIVEDLRKLEVNPVIDMERLRQYQLTPKILDDPNIDLTFINYTDRWDV